MSTDTRSGRTMGSMIVSMGVIVGILVVMALVVQGRSGENIPSVDYTLDAAALADEADFTVLAPEDLPDGWVGTSTNLSTGDPLSWTVGFATPDDRHADYVIGDADTLVDSTLDSPEPDGTTSVAGTEWERYRHDDGRHALVAEEGGATLIVSGGSGYGELETLAGSLAEEKAE